MENMKDKGTEQEKESRRVLFSKDGINGKKFEKWTEDKTHEMVNKLEEWLRPSVIYNEDTGEIEDIIFKKNKIFFKDWLMANGLYNDWIRYVSNKYPSVYERIAKIKETQEDLIVRASAMGQIKERTAQFILMQWYDWRTKTDNANTDMTPVIFEVTKTYENKK